MHTHTLASRRSDRKGQSREIRSTGGKAVVLGSACFVQGVVVTRVSLLGLPGQDHGGGVRGWGWWEVAVPVGLLAAAMAVAGLWLSALVRTVERTAPTLVALVMSQVVLSSAPVHFAGRYAAADARRADRF